MPPTRTGDVLNWASDLDPLKTDQAEVAVEWYRSRPPLRRDVLGRIVRRPVAEVEADRLAMSKIKALKNRKSPTY